MLNNFLRRAFHIIALNTLLCAATLAQAPNTVSTSPKTAVPQSSPVTDAKTQTLPVILETNSPGNSSDVTTPGTVSLLPQPEGDTHKLPLSSLQNSRTVPPLPSFVRFGIKGDNTLPLSLNEAIRRALENNNDIEVARDDVRLAETVLRSSEAFYDPVFSITPQFDSRVQPVTSAVSNPDQFGPVSTRNMGFSSTVTKHLSKGGGTYQGFFNNTRSTTNSPFSLFRSFYSSEVGVQFTQPLLRNREIDINRRDIRIQRKQLAQSDAEFRRSVIEQIARVQHAYWDLVFALRNQQNRLANLNVARVLFQQTEQRIATGSIAPLERAEVQTELSNRQALLLRATEDVSIAENALKRLMLPNTLAPEWDAALIPTDEPSFDERPADLGDVLEEAQANRPELTRLRLQRDINDIDIEYFKNQTRPRVDIQATVSTAGLAGTLAEGNGAAASTAPFPLISGNQSTSANAYLLSQINQLRANQNLPPAVVPLVTPQALSVPGNLVGGYGRTLRNLFSLQAPNITVGVVIEIPFGNRGARANLAGARIRQEQLTVLTRSQNQDIEVQVRNAGQAVESARQRVLTARTARESAELQQEGEHRLYEVGRSTTFLIFQRENQLADARNSELRAKTDYNKALADLQHATSTTLRANNVTVIGQTNREQAGIRDPTFR
jgi:outer membrane protein TolC